MVVSHKNSNGTFSVVYAQHFLAAVSLFNVCSSDTRRIYTLTGALINANPLQFSRSAHCAVVELRLTHNYFIFSPVAKRATVIFV